MCLAKAYLKSENEEEMLLKDIVSLEVLDKRIVLTTLMEETKTIEASIKRIDFLRGAVVLEK